MDSIKLNKVTDIDGTEIEWNDIVIDCGNNMFAVTAMQIDSDYMDKIMDDEGMLYSPDEVKIVLKHQDRFLACRRCGEFIKFNNTTRDGFCQKCSEKIKEEL